MLPAQALFLPVLHVSGDYYDVGFAIGKTFKQQISDFYKVNTDVGYLLKFVDSDLGRKIYNEFLDAVNDVFPQYVEELQGICDGSEQPFEQMFLSMMDLDIDSECIPLGSGEFTKMSEHAPESHGLAGCTDVYLNSPGQLGMGHTEDSYLAFEHNCAVVQAHIMSPSPRGKFAVTEEKFTSFIYPGFMPGYCMSFNKYGIIYTINTMAPKGFARGKIPSCFVSRALLAAKCINDVDVILKSTAIARGISVNLADCGNKKIINYEVAYPLEDDKNSRVDVQVIEEQPDCATRYHCNTYQRIQLAEKGKQLSSRTRAEKIEELPGVISVDNIRTVLSDTSHPEYPIFRHQRLHAMKSVTLCTGIFDLMKNTWSIYMDKSSTSKGPVVIFDLPVCKGSSN